MMLKITNIILGFVVVLVLLELVSMSCYFKIGFIGWRSKKKEEEEEAKEKQKDSKQNSKDKGKDKDKDNKKVDN